MPHAFDSAPASDSVMRQLVRAVVDKPATIEDYQKLAEIAQDAQEQNLEPEQIEAKIRETTLFAGLLQYLSKKENQSQILAILAIMVPIVFYVLSRQEPTKVEMVKPDVAEIVKQPKKHTDENCPAKPILTDNLTGEKPAECQ